MKNKKQEKPKLMDTEQILSNMDIMYHIKRTNNQEAIELLEKLKGIMENNNLTQMYSSPTELIINASYIYAAIKDDCSSIDREIYDVIRKLGYLRNT